MAWTNNVNTFFIACEPGVPGREQRTDLKASTSWQKHASREYHRKKRQRKATKSQGLRGQDSSHADHYAYKARTILPKTNEEIITEPEFWQGVQERLTISKIGGGKLDPFGVAVRSDTSKYAIAMLHHAIDQQWPGFDAGTGASKIKQTILSCAMLSRASFYAIVFAAAAHNAFAYTGVNVPVQNKMLRLSYKGLALSHLRREIENLTGPASEELLMCVVVLAAHGHGDMISPPPTEEKRMKGALAIAQHSQFYGEMRWESAHMTALASLIIARGGLHTIKSPGLAESIKLADNLEAFKNVRRPVFPLIQPIDKVMSSGPWDRLRARSPNSTTLTGFRGCPETIVSHPLMQLIRYTQLVTAGYEAFKAMNEAAPSLVQLLAGRNSILHEILALDPRVRLTRSDDPHVPSRLPLPRSHSNVHRGTLDVSGINDDVLLAFIRLATLAFVLLVLFPMPRAAGIHDRLSDELFQSLVQCNNRGLWERFSDLLLWGTLLGGAIANESSRSYFEETLLSWESGNALFQHKGKDIKTEAELWRHARYVCGSFLWYDGSESELQQHVGLFWDKVLKRRSQATLSLYP